MKDLVTFIVRIGKSHWGFLRQSFEGWTFLIPGHPLNRNFATVSEPEAKEAASTAVAEHFRKNELERELADVSELSWRLAVRYIAA